MTETPPASMATADVAAPKITGVINGNTASVSFAQMNQELLNALSPLQRARAIPNPTVAQTPPTPATEFMFKESDIGSTVEAEVDGIWYGAVLERIDFGDAAIPYYVRCERYAGWRGAGRVRKAGSVKEPPVTIDLSKLDPLVLGAEKKASIVSVISQHKNQDRIFKEWGLEETVKYGKGMTLLLWGEPGVGKTFAAHCIADALGKKLYSAEVAKMQSSEPGGMERNLQTTFRTATLNKEVLLLDECDSLLASRDHVGMVMSAEINCLLGELEKFEGVCILTTNRVGELDKALERRISLVMEFPKPGPKSRLEIWKRLVPSKMPLAEDVSFERMAEWEITGGIIKNVLLNAARFACGEDAEKVGMGHFERAYRHTESSKSAFETPSKYMHAYYTKT